MEPCLAHPLKTPLPATRTRKGSVKSRYYHSPFATENLQATRGDQAYFRISKFNFFPDMLLIIREHRSRWIMCWSALVGPSSSCGGSRNASRTLAIFHLPTWMILLTFFRLRYRSLRRNGKLPPLFPRILRRRASICITCGLRSASASAPRWPCTRLSFAAQCLLRWKRERAAVMTASLALPVRGGASSAMSSRSHPSWWMPTPPPPALDSERSTLRRFTRLKSVVTRASRRRSIPSPTATSVPRCHRCAGATVRRVACVFVQKATASHVTLVY